MGKLFADIASLIPAMIIGVVAMYATLAIARKIAERTKQDEDVVMFLSLIALIMVMKAFGY